MLAETGDNAFRLGHVDQDGYNSLSLGKLIGAISSPLTQCAPNAQLAFESHSGGPAIITPRRGALGISRCRRFAARQKGIMGLLLDIWTIPRRPAAVLRPMGGLMTLPLYAQARTALDSSRQSPLGYQASVVDSSAERQAADFALAKTPDESPASEGSGLAVDLCRIGRFNRQSGFGPFDGRLVAVPQKYGYLETVMFSGSIIRPGNSAPCFVRIPPQSFLVTERCNNYC